MFSFEAQTLNFGKCAGKKIGTFFASAAALQTHSGSLQLIGRVRLTDLFMKHSNGSPAVDQITRLHKIGCLILRVFGYLSVDGIQFWQQKTASETDHFRQVSKACNHHFITRLFSPSKKMKNKAHLHWSNGIEDVRMDRSPNGPVSDSIRSFWPYRTRREPSTGSRPFNVLLQSNFLAKLSASRRLLSSDGCSPRPMP